jgi:hypothetical protein
MGMDPREQMSGPEPGYPGYRSTTRRVKATPIPLPDIAEKYTPPPDPLERIANALERIADKIDGWSYIGDQN